MADAGIKKVTILNEDLPIINSEIAGYGVRYRIVSEDRNRVSHWSPTYYLDAGYSYINGKPIPDPTKVGDAVSIVWDRVEVKSGNVSIGKIRDYEIWVRWDRGDGGDWIYEGKAQTNSVTLFKPDHYYKTINGVPEQQSLAPNKISVEIYLESVPVARSSGDLLRYEITNHTV
jgi:hypothetical protein